MICALPLATFSIVYYKIFRDKLTKPRSVILVFLKFSQAIFREISKTIFFLCISCQLLLFGAAAPCKNHISLSERKLKTTTTYFSPYYMVTNHNFLPLQLMLYGFKTVYFVCLYNRCEIFSHSVYVYLS